MAGFQSVDRGSTPLRGVFDAGVQPRQRVLAAARDAERREVQLAARVFRVHEAAGSTPASSTLVIAVVAGWLPKFG